MMNQLDKLLPIDGDLKVIDGIPMMSHKQIAEVVAVRPDNVKRTIDRLADRLGDFTFTPMEDMVEIGGGANRLTKVYYLNEADSVTVAAQLMPELTYDLVKEWQRLKGANQSLQEQQINKQTVPCRDLIIFTKTDKS